MTSTSLIQALHDALTPHARGLVCAYLFGSQARQEAGAHSDVDLAVLYREEPPLGLDGLGLDLAAALERAVGRPVDLVVLNRASPDLIHRVLRDGILVLENDASARIRFEMKARAEYFDVLPYLREYRRGPGARHDRP
ncbi:MAG: nucleotidyltransferase domain-containing protein [Thiohalomonadaceae bacterium]